LENLKPGHKKFSKPGSGKKDFKTGFACDFDQSEEDVLKVSSRRGHRHLCLPGWDFRKKGRLSWLWLGHGVPVIGTQRGKLPPELKEEEIFFVFRPNIKKEAWATAF